MKYFKRKKITVVFLFIFAFLAGAQNAKAASECKQELCGTSGMRQCYCSKDSIADSVQDKRISAHSSVLLCCSQFLPACTQACKDGGYASKVLVDSSYSNENPANYLSQIDGVAVVLKTAAKTGCCVKATGTGRNSCVSTTDKEKCEKEGGNYGNGDCSYVATNCGAENLGTQTTSQVSNDDVPGVSVAKTGIVQCGRPGGKMCTICDLIAGLNGVIQFIWKIAIGVALLAMAVGGVMYVISAGNDEMMGKAKTAIANAAIGFVIIFAAYLIVNTTIMYLGTKPDLGIKVTSWGNFDCTANPNR